MNFLPDRKVWAGGVSGLVAWFVLFVANKLHFPLDATTQAFLPVVVGSVISYITPPAVKDIISRLNDDLVKIAQDDPKIPVTPPAPPAA